MRVVVLEVNGVTGRAIADAFVTSGWDVPGTGRDPSRFPRSLRRPAFLSCARNGSA